MNSLYPYEILVILDPRPTDEEVAALLTKLREKLKTLGAEIGKAESWGKRRLAYDMRKQREGTYAVLESWPSRPPSRSSSASSGSTSRCSASSRPAFR